MTGRGDIGKVNAVANKAEETRSKPVQGEVDWKLEGNVKPRNSCRGNVVKKKYREESNETRYQVQPYAKEAGKEGHDVGSQDDPSRVAVDKNLCGEEVDNKAQLGEGAGEDAKVRPVEGGLDVPTCRRLPSYRRS